MQSNQQDPIPGAGGESIPAIPDHQLLKVIARGSYGQVWLARNTLGAYRAIKIVFESTFRDKRPFERELGGVQRFEPVSRLHEGLMDVLQVGRNEEKGYFYCVMELADDVVLGQCIEPDRYTPHTLAWQVAKQKRLAFAACLEMGIAIASALDFLHKRGLIHRDVKPSNIVFINGVPKLADIGLVAEMSEARSYVGTEGFIPPEGPGTVQSDIYSLGKVLYEISTGKDRYEFPELPTLLDDTSHGAELIGLNRVILQACRTDPRQRYRSAGDMLEDLQALQKGKPIKHRRLMNPRLAIGMPVLGGVVTLALLFGFLGRLRHPGRLHGAAGGEVSGSGFVASGLVGWWRGEGDARDSVGNNHGALIGEVLFTQGKVGQGFQLNGDDQFVVVSSSPSLNATQALTLGAWVFPAKLPVPEPGKDGEEIAGKDGTVSNRQYLLTLDVRQVFSAHVAVSDKGYLQVYGGTPVQTNGWYHVVMTYDQKALKLYVNGILDASRAWTGPIMVSDEPFRIGGGASEGIPPFHFAGLIDEVTLFSRALSESEIQTLYQLGNSGSSLEPSNGPGSSSDASQH